MKILLVRPNSRIISTPAPLGLAYVAEALRRTGFHEVRILDGRNERLSLHGISGNLRDFRPDAVGIAALSCESREAHALAAVSKCILPHSPIVIGGPYATANREEILSDPNVDVLVVGEGEATAAELFDALEEESDLLDVLGIIVRRDGLPYFTGPRPPIDDVDSLVPAWDLLDPPRYFKRASRNSLNILKCSHKALSVFTSRGCPYSCIFCHNVFGKRFRARRVECVVDEITMLADRYGVQELEIIDDCFNLDLNRAKAIARGIVERNLALKITLPNGIRGDLVDEELLNLLKEAGFYRISFAVESGSPRIQALIKKKINLDRMNWAITETARRKIITTGYFIMGFPTETVEDMATTADFAAASDLHVASFFYLSPFPGTEVARIAGRGFTEVGFDDYGTMSVNISAATDQELHAAVVAAYRRFYLDPRRALRILQIAPKNLRTILNALLVFRLLFPDSVNWRGLFTNVVATCRRYRGI